VTARASRLAAAVGAAAAAAAIAALSAGEAGRDLDRRAFASVNAGAGPAADLFFRGVTELGSIAASIGATAAMALGGRARDGASAMGAATVTWFAGQRLKAAHLRPRPYETGERVRQLIASPSGTSWPSSHPAVLAAFTTVAARNLGLPRAARVALGGLVGAVALSRVYVGVHYPSDVVGGLFVGRAVADAWSAIVPEGRG
jgi:membrane-associated phospholipid phosphatase